jgi:hypothetical protein
VEERAGADCWGFEQPILMPARPFQVIPPRWSTQPAPLDHPALPLSPSETSRLSALAEAATLRAGESTWLRYAIYRAAQECRDAGLSRWDAVDSLRALFARPCAESERARLVHIMANVTWWVLERYADTPVQYVQEL